VVEQGEFPGIRTRGEYQTMIEDVMLNPAEVRSLGGGRMAFWRDGVVVIRDPNTLDGGSAFVPRDGYDYFRNQLS
jgi:hypothetical protein